MLSLGVLYHNGQGVAQDYGAARRWYEQAGGGQATPWPMFGLGVLYNNGEGVTRDYAVARRWFEQAAAQGEASAMTNLAFLYEQGLGVAKDLVTAATLVRKGRRPRNEKAKTLLAKLPK